VLWSFVCAFPALAMSLSPDDAAARDVALQWLQLVDSGDYEHAVLQTPEQIGVQQNWMTYLLAHRKPLGRVTKRQVVEVRHKPTIHGARTWWKYKVIRFKTSFTGKPVAMEEVVLTKMACCWEVSGYTIFESEPDGHSAKWNETREHAGMFSDK
jgi:Protein of unknown function (DUF4019)